MCHQDRNQWHSSTSMEYLSNSYPCLCLRLERSPMYWDITITFYPNMNKELKHCLACISHKCGGFKMMHIKCINHCSGFFAWLYINYHSEITVRPIQKPLMPFYSLWKSAQNWSITEGGTEKPTFRKAFISSLVAFCFF